GGEADVERRRAPAVEEGAVLVGQRLRVAGRLAERGGRGDPGRGGGGVVRAEADAGRQRGEREEGARGDAGAATGAHEAAGAAAAAAVHEKGMDHRNQEENARTAWWRSSVDRSSCGCPRPCTASPIATASTSSRPSSPAGPRPRSPICTGTPAASSRSSTARSAAGIA